MALEIRIGRGDGDQPGQCRRQLILRLLDPPERLGVVEDLPGHGQLADAAPGLGHRGDRLPLERGGALHRLDEVRDEVGAALVDVLHLRPLSLDGLFEAHEPVVRRGREPAHDDHQNTTTPSAIRTIRFIRSSLGEVHDERQGTGSPDRYRVATPSSCHAREEGRRAYDPGPNSPVHLLQNAVEWLEAGQAELVVMSPTHDSHQRKSVGDGQRAFFDSRVPWGSSGADYQRGSDAGILVRDDGVVGGYRPNSDRLT